MSKLSETLEELLAEHNLDKKSLAKAIGVSESRITDYTINDKLPTVATIVKIADFFHCSIDFLLGREYEVKCKSFKAPAPFAERIAYLRNYFKYTHKQIYNGTSIQKSSYFDWVNGKRQPSLDNIIKLADLFGCSIEFVLGREN